jgi:NAD(P)-dependent dehydrogenase (short-subunit alcohol dehydrogenase family)
MSGSQKVAIVTGSSSGIGLETSITLAKNGFLTYATILNLDKSSIIRQDSDPLTLHGIRIILNKVPFHFAI